MKKLAVLFFSICLFFTLALPAFAGFQKLEDTDPKCVFISDTGKHVVTIDCIPVIVGNVIYWLLILAGIAALILIIISGFKFVTSGGDPKQAEGARKTLTWAIIGLIVVLLSFGIINFISYTTGVDKECLTKFGFSQCKTACSDENPSGYCRTGTCQRIGSPTEYGCR